MLVPGRIDVLPLLQPLHDKLMELYRELSPEDWNARTVCPGWTVKDIASHLLDTDLRKLSAGRDGHRVQPNRAIHDHQSLVHYLNDLNQSWVSATRRLGPAVLAEWQGVSGPAVVAYWAGIDMHAIATFPVGWAGQESSPNWFDCAREYTERWHHQQQMRDAVGARPLTGKPWLGPILETFVHALPVAYRNTQAAEGTTIGFEFKGEAGSEWTLERGPDQWILYHWRGETADSVVTTDTDTAWRIFTKGISQTDAAARTHLAGRSEFAAPFLRALAVMAIRSEDEVQT